MSSNPLKNNDEFANDPPMIIMFDFDGVIIDTKGPELIAYQCMKDSSLGWDQEVLKEMKPIDIIRRFEMSDSENSYRAIKKMYYNFKDLIPGTFNRIRFFSRMGRYFRDYERMKSNFIEGTIETLRRLHEKGVLIGICTNSEGSRVPYWLERTGCSEYVQAYSSRDDKHQFGIKPSPRPLLKLLERIKKKMNLKRLDKSKIYFCGDNPTDVWSAQNAGIHSVAVLSGHSNYDELAYIGADYILNSINDLFTIPEITNYEKVRHYQNI
ncbi:MAG: HAD family hydrolase [Promethearchaeota archaeon]